MSKNERLLLVVRHLRRAVKKVKFIILSLKWRRYWRFITTNTKSANTKLRRWSFNDRMGLYGCFGDEKLDQSCTVKRFQRTRSCVSEGNDDDIDRRAEIFISNFRYRLVLERQVSLELRYSQEHSSNMEDDGNS